MPAVAVTDTNNLFCALEFSVTALAAGIQPIVGCQLDLALPHDRPDRAIPTAPVVLLCQSETGWRNLMKLHSRFYLRPGAQPLHVTSEELAAFSEGLILLTGGAEGALGRLIQERQITRAEALLSTLARAFPNRLYIELERHPDSSGVLPEAEATTEPVLIDLAYAFELPLVATNNVHFATPEMFPAQDALLCIKDNAYVDQLEPRRRLTPEHYFKSEDAMVALFADLPEALENTVEIARRSAFAVQKHKPILPRFAEDEAEELRKQASFGLAARLARLPYAFDRKAYEERLAYELEVIVQMGFAGYFLIVADFIKWAKAQGIPVGPGRGSGAGSLVAWALTITDLDPLRYGLLFERFLNPERVSMPDFDVDFCMDRREEVIAYVQRKYGSEHVGQIITFGALLSKAAVRDAGRVLQMPYNQVDRLAKLIPVEGVKPVSIAKALAEEPRLKEAARDPKVARLFDIAGKIEGLLRNASTHAAGVVIADRPLDELVPLYKDPRSEMPATQFNMKWAEAVGLVKFDFLGLKTLTVIRRTVDLIRAQGRHLHIAKDGRRLYEPPEGAVDDIGAIPLDDHATFQLYASAQTVAVFQVESPGMMDALRRMRPTCIEDIVALVALYRPGPMENIPTYCAVKNGEQPRQSIHPLIDPILDETMGIIIYQEQVMQIAQKMAGYSLGGADLLRRAMGKKIPEEMARERPKFITGAVANGVDEKKAGEVFDLLEKFANYGFNKSHAAAYALVSYQTAWLKANHPVEFMAAVMDCDIHLTDKLALYKRELDRMGIRVIPPCVNRSGARFRVEEGAIVYALGALKNVGVEAMRLIEAARENRPFRDVADFARRVDLKRIGKRALEMVVKAGALDCLERNRRRLFEGLDRLLAYSAAIHEAQARGQVGLFGAAEALPPPKLDAVPDWPAIERLAEEHAAIGFYLSGHPLDDWMGALKRVGVITYAELARRAELAPTIARVAGAVSNRRERKSARGSRYAFVGFSDPSGLFEVTVFSDVLEAARESLEPGSLVVVTVEATMEGESVRLVARGVEPVQAVAARSGPAGLILKLATVESVPTLARMFAALPQEPRRAGPVRIVLPDPNSRAEIEIELPQKLLITPELRSEIRILPVVIAVEEF